MLQITAVFTPKFHLHSKHILCFCQWPILGKGKDTYIPVLQCLSCSPSPPSLLRLSGEIEKKSVFNLDDGGWWGGKSASHCIWWYSAYITGSRILTFYPREIGAINRELSKMLDAVHLLILFFFY